MAYHARLCSVSEGPLCSPFESNLCDEYLFIHPHHTNAHKHIEEDENDDLGIPAADVTPYMAHHDECHDVR